MVNYAVVGIEGYGRTIIESINEAAMAGVDCRIVAAGDARLGELGDRAAKMRSQGVEMFDDAIAMFDAMNGKCDAVYIATGIASHAPLTIAAAKRGYHVHLEKPPAATVQEVDLMLEALEANDRFCLVGFQQVHRDDIRLIKERLVDGKLGKPKRLTCYASWPRELNYYERNNWAGKIKLGDNWVLDGPAMNALAHQVTNLLLLGSTKVDTLATPTAVRAELYTAGQIESHTTAAILVETAEGAPITFICSHAGGELDGPQITLEAEGGVAKWGLLGGGKHEIRYNDGTVECFDGPVVERTAMIANFTEAVAAGDGSGLRCPLSEARKMIAVINGAHESSGKVHRIDDEYTQQTVGEGGTPRVMVDGLDEAMSKASREYCLISDLESGPGWAVRTEKYDLAGYVEFPQRFEC